MAQEYQIDSVDRQILAELLADARTPYLEIARKLIVSGGTIHQRIERMKKAGVISGSSVKINLKNLGFDVTVFLGIHVTSTNLLNAVISKLKELPEVVEAHYTTGNFGLLVKVHTKSISDFHFFLSQKIQTIDGVQSTESFICLDSPISKEISL